MDLFCETLFEYYGMTVLDKSGRGYDEAELARWLDGLRVGEKSRYFIIDGLFDYYYRWASAAFEAGLRLGLARSDGQVRRPSPEQV